MQKSHYKRRKKTKGHRVRNIIYSILVAIVVFIVLSHLISGKASFIENGIGTIFSPVQKVFRNLTVAVKSWFVDSENTTLEDKYEDLLIQNDLLMIEMSDYDEIVAENERLQTLVDAKPQYSSLQPVFAKVIAKDFGVWFNTFTLNVGSNDGVSINMAVVNADGLIGRVSGVGYNFCNVISLIDTRSSVAAVINRTRDNGMLQGNTDPNADIVECRMYYISNLGDVRIGDSVYTSGLDSRFPKGLLIGKVISVSRSGDSSDKYVTVEPAVDFSGIEEVYVLRQQVEDISKLPVLPTATPQPVITAAPTATSDIYAIATKRVADDDAPYSYPTPTLDPNVTPDPTPTPKPTKPVPEAGWLNH